MNIIVTLIVISLVAWAIIKNIKPQTVLVFGGLILMIFSYLFGYKTGFVPANQSTGLPFFDMFVYIKRTMASDIAGLGLTIMVGAGFAKYMDYIGASSRMVEVAMQPLKKLNAPYVVNAAGFTVCMIMSLAIQSASALSMLTMVTVFPILINLGVSRVAAASVVATGHLLDIGPAAATSLVVVKVADVGINKFFVEYQLPVYFIACVIVTIVHYFWQKHLDKKEGLYGLESNVAVEVDISKSKGEELNPPGPNVYMILPALPLILILTFSEYGLKGYKMDIITAMLISFTTAMLFELVRYRDYVKVAGSIQKFFAGMGQMFAVTVTLVTAAQVFAYGITCTGFVDALIKGTQNMGLSVNLITIGICALIIAISVVTGSGVAAMYSFAPIIPPFAAGIGANTLTILQAMQNAASLGRLVSPVAAVIIIVAGIAGVSPIALVKRNSLPIAVAIVVTMTAVLVMF